MLSSSLRRTETAEAETAASVETLGARRAALAAETNRLQATIASLLPLMRNLEAAPLGGMLSSPARPEDTGRDLLVLHALGARLAREARELRTTRLALDATARRLDDQQRRLADEHRTASLRANTIEKELGGALAAAESPAEKRAEAAAGDLAATAGRSASLRDAVASLRQAPARLPAPAGASTGIGATPSAVRGPPPAVLALPVAGPVIRRFGAPDETGPAKGATFAPPPGALVSAPCSGRVDFAGPFRSYGRMVIIDCGGDARVVLAGLDRVDTPSGAPVRRGEPVGRMPDFDPVSAGARPTLLEQLRRGTETADPFATLTVARGARPNVPHSARPYLVALPGRPPGHSAIRSGARRRRPTIGR